MSRPAPTPAPMAAPQGQTCALCGAPKSSAAPAEFAQLTAIARPKTLAPGQTHTLQGDAARDYAAVTSGVAKLVKGAEDGRSQIVGLLFAPDFLGGAMGAGDGTEAPYTIEAVSDLTLDLFPRAPFEALVARTPALETRLMDQARDELLLARDWMVLLGRKTARERVASFLLHVDAKMRPSACACAPGFELPLGRADIADYVGLTIETVSRQMSRLKKDGVIVMDGPKQVVWVDTAQLQVIAGF
ncbi:MAG: Crp/Fnr family transcriptional regulator [Pseudomonadota bacterium]